MSTNPHVALIVPRLGRDPSSGVAARSSALARIAGRGVLTTLPQRRDIETWRAGLLESLGLDGDLPVHRPGPVIGAAMGGAADEYWLCATPMHFAAGLSDLTAAEFAAGHQATEAERAELAASLAPHLRSEGLELIAASADDWLLRSQRPFDASLATPAAAARDLATAMPQGRDAAVVKRLMAEMQMLLHEHPVNVERERAGAPLINALWLHGGGVISAVKARNLPRAFGDDAYLRGLYALYGARAPQQLATPDALLGNASAIGVLDEPNIDAIEERWLAPLLRALRARQILSLDLVIDRWRLSIERAGLFKFWRGAQPVERWPT